MLVSLGYLDYALLPISDLEVSSHNYYPTHPRTAYTRALLTARQVKPAPPRLDADVLTADVVWPGRWKDGLYSKLCLTLRGNGLGLGLVSTWTLLHGFSDGPIGTRGSTKHVYATVVSLVLHIVKLHYNIMRSLRGLLSY